MKKLILLILSIIALSFYTPAQDKDKPQDKSGFDGFWILEKVENPRNAIAKIDKKNSEYRTKNN
jgi:hypothetical protein